MGVVIKFPEKNIQDASSEQLKHEWDLWFNIDYDDIDGDIEGMTFDYEDIHAKLNRRGEGAYCAC